MRQITLNIEEATAASRDFCLDLLTSQFFLYSSDYILSLSDNVRCYIKFTEDATVSSPAGKTYSYNSVLAGDKYLVEAVPKITYAINYIKYSRSDCSVA